MPHHCLKDRDHKTVAGRLVKVVVHGLEEGLVRLASDKKRRFDVKHVDGEHVQF